MIPHFKIEKSEHRYYEIKRKIRFYPFYYMRTMTKNEFVGDLTRHGHSALRDFATFKTIDDAFNALQQHDTINGFTEVVVKVRDKIKYGRYY